MRFWIIPICDKNHFILIMNISIHTLPYYTNLLLKHCNVLVNINKNHWQKQKKKKLHNINSVV
jgi:hypothetical protein